MVLVLFVVSVVASFTDAWIETISEGVIDKPETVASFTDAWIETSMPDNKTFCGMSHLLQMRGLKPHVQNRELGFRFVASFTDAWIETMYRNYPIHLDDVASFTDAWIETSC